MSSFVLFFEQTEKKAIWTTGLIAPNWNSGNFFTIIILNLNMYKIWPHQSKFKNFTKVTPDGELTGTAWKNILYTLFWQS